jgi:hypothetical protein
VLPGSQCAPPSVKYSQLAPASSPVTLISLQDQWYLEELCRRRMPAEFLSATGGAICGLTGAIYG